MVPFPLPLVAKEHPFSDQRPVDQAMVEKATEEWRESIHHPGEGNSRFFVYAVALRAAGMSLPEIESKLVEEARFGHSADERRASESQAFIASLKKTWRKAV